MILPSPPLHGHLTCLITVSTPRPVTGSPAVCQRPRCCSTKRPGLTRAVASGICMWHESANMSTRLLAFAFPFPPICFLPERLMSLSGGLIGQGGVWRARWPERLP